MIIWVDYYVLREISRCPSILDVLVNIGVKYVIPKKNQSFTKNHSNLKNAPLYICISFYLKSIKF